MITGLISIICLSFPKLLIPQTASLKLVPTRLIFCCTFATSECKDTQKVVFIGDAKAISFHKENLDKRVAFVRTSTWQEGHLRFIISK